MAFKLFLIVAILCSVQLPGSTSKNLKILNSLGYVNLFYQYYERKDDFGESVTLYQLYLPLVNPTEYTHKIKKCYSTQSSAYEAFVKSFVEKVNQTAYSLKNQGAALPLKKLITALQPYPTCLTNLINQRKYTEAAKIMQETIAKVIFFDIRYKMVTKEGNKKNQNAKYLWSAYTNYLKYRQEAKTRGQEIMALLKNCMTDDIGVLFIPLFPHYHNMFHHNNLL